MEYTILYISNATVDFSDKDLLALLEKSRNNNSRKNTSGFLIFVKNLFIQVLEGQKEEVLELFGRIKKDKRHENLIVLYESEIEERLFDSWSMAFRKYSEQEITELSYFTLEEFQEITNGVGSYDVLKVLRTILDANLK